MFQILLTAQLEATERKETQEHQDRQDPPVPMTKKTESNTPVRKIKSVYAGKLQTLGL